MFFFVHTSHWLAIVANNAPFNKLLLQCCNLHRCHRTECHVDRGVSCLRSRRGWREGSHAVVVFLFLSAPLFPAQEEEEPSPSIDPSNRRKKKPRFKRKEEEEISDFFPSPFRIWESVVVSQANLSSLPSRQASDGWMRERPPHARPPFMWRRPHFYLAPRPTQERLFGRKRGDGESV